MIWSVSTLGLFSGATMPETFFSGSMVDSLVQLGRSALCENHYKVRGGQPPGLPRSVVLERSEGTVPAVGARDMGL